MRCLSANIQNKKRLTSQSFKLYVADDSTMKSESSLTLNEDLTQLIIFVIMPYGVRTDLATGVTIDFDQIYMELLVPAAAKVGLKIVRSDRDSAGGMIHATMFEKVILADIVIADISFPNPNVYYELGLRHSTRSFTTITISQDGTIFPFDLKPLKHILYIFENNEIKNKEKVINSLVDRLLLAVESKNATDSPIFQTIANYPGLDLNKDIIESFRDRTKTHSQHESFEAIRFAVKSSNIGMLDSITLDGNTHPELLFDLIIAYRDLKQYDAMMDIINRYPFIQGSDTGKELLAFGLNKKGGEGNRERAEIILKTLIEEKGNTSERCSLLGSVYKSMHKEAFKAGKINTAQMHLGSAIQAYEEGFLADPRDPYPGINYAVLLHANKDFEKLYQITPVIAFALLRRGGLESKDYFDIATHITLHILLGDKDMAIKAAKQARRQASARWMLETTSGSGANLKDICDYFDEIRSILLDD